MSHTIPMMTTAVQGEPPTREGKIFLLARLMRLAGDPQEPDRELTADEIANHPISQLSSDATGWTGDQRWTDEELTSCPVTVEAKDSSSRLAREDRTPSGTNDDDLANTTDRALVAFAPFASAMVILIADLNDCIRTLRSRPSRSMLVRTCRMSSSSDDCTASSSRRTRFGDAEARDFTATRFEEVGRTAAAIRVGSGGRGRYFLSRCSQS